MVRLWQRFVDSTTYSLILNKCSINVKNFLNFHKSIFFLDISITWRGKTINFSIKEERKYLFPENNS